MDRRAGGGRARLRRITELEEGEGGEGGRKREEGGERGWEGEEEVGEGRMEGEGEGADFASVTVEAWTSFNRLHTVNNLSCLAWAQVLAPRQGTVLQEKGLASSLGAGDTVVDFGCG
jgi:hypothetical protein